MKSSAFQEETLHVPELSLSEKVNDNCPGALGRCACVVQSKTTPARTPALAWHVLWMLKAKKNPVLQHCGAETYSMV